MMYVPILNNILVEEKKAPEDKIIIYDLNDFNRVIDGVVVAAGPGDWISNTKAFAEPFIKVGDVIKFSLNSAKEINIEDKPYFLMNERDVLLLKESNG